MQKTELSPQTNNNLFEDSPQEMRESFSWKLASILFIIHLLAIPAFFHFSEYNFLAWLTSHFIFGTFGASLGLHRYFSHRSYRINSKTFEIFIGLISTLCFQGGPIFWAAAHRSHHRFSENLGDPHASSRGFFWSHFLWLTYNNPNGFSYLKAIRNVRDLRANKMFQWLELYSTKINILFLGLIFVTCYLNNNIGLFFWIGPLRIVSVWHSTWLVNSYAHRAKLFRKQKTISYRDSILLCFVIGGDGNHQFHHLKPSSPHHSKNSFSFDYGYLILKILSLCSIVDLKQLSKREEITQQTEPKVG